MSKDHPLVAEYRKFSPISESLAKKAKEVFPGGDTRASAHYNPYPLTMSEASGCVLKDADGNEILDFMNNFTSLIHGHTHPQIVESVQKQISLGSAYAAPSQNQIELAEIITERVPSVEQMRFTSSGTEATTMAIRCARAATGRQKIMKMEGGYHGSYEMAEVSLVPMPKERGDLNEPNSLPVDKSFPNSVLEDTVICPYNQPDMAKTLIEKHSSELAAIIVEPVLGSMGMIPATKEFLLTLRDSTTKSGIILIFDEVISLRINQGGAQSLFGVMPDITCMGKIIGGGLPIGAVGGKRELMQLFSPEIANPVMHASTFSGNALTMSAGLPAMKAFDDKECNRINDLAEKLREGFNQAFSQARILGNASGIGSLTNIHFANKQLNDSRDFMDGLFRSKHIGNLLHLTMLRNGVMSASRLMFCTSTAMTETEIENAVTSLHESLAELRPFIEKECPELMV
tara:strand:+ start:97 stop:1470 length:1374 start_codon:yes stop_codon:yes gene_type:complete